MLLSFHLIHHLLEAEQPSELLRFSNTKHPSKATSERDCCISSPLYAIQATESTSRRNSLPFLYCYPSDLQNRSLFEAFSPLYYRSASTGAARFAASDLALPDLIKISVSLDLDLECPSALSSRSTSNCLNPISSSSCRGLRSLDPISYSQWIDIQSSYSTSSC